MPRPSRERDGNSNVGDLFLTITVQAAPFRYDLPSMAYIPGGAKVVSIDAEASCATPYVYEHKTIHREVYERALRRTSACRARPDIRLSLTADSSCRGKGKRAEA